MVAIDRSLLKGETPRFSADVTHPLSCERPVNFPRLLVGPLGIGNIMSMSDINIHSASFKLTRPEQGQGHGQGKGPGHRPGHRHGHGRGHEQGHGHGLRIGI